MADKEKKEKKIIIDEDFKAQAQKEKEILSAQEKVEHEQAEQEITEGSKEHPQLPPADFVGLISMLATQAFFALGLIREEKGKDRPPDLTLAKYNIDMLEVIQQKTKGNLTDDETKLVENTLHQLRMAFVKATEQTS
jgi:hypothetical protein